MYYTDSKDHTDPRDVYTAKTKKANTLTGYKQHFNPMLLLHSSCPLMITSQQKSHPLNKENLTNEGQELS